MEALYLNGKKISEGKLETISDENIADPAFKPIGDLHSVPHFRCGCCRSSVVVFEGDPRPERCKWCNSKIDWTSVPKEKRRRQK